MDTQEKKPVIDPLRRVFIPRESVGKSGMIYFKTLNGQQYVRHPETGVVRRVKRSSSNGND